MSADLIILLPEYLYLQMVSRDGPIPIPEGGVDWISARYLIDRGLLEIVGSELLATLRGAAAAVAKVRPIAECAVSIPAAAFEGCEAENRCPAEEEEANDSSPGKGSVGD